METDRAGSRAEPDEIFSTTDRNVQNGPKIDPKVIKRKKEKMNFLINFLQNLFQLKTSKFIRNVSPRPNLNKRIE